MKYIKLYENFNKVNNLIIVDVQRSFKKWFTDNYVKAIKTYSAGFDNVYQIWDNHTDKEVDSDYLYDESPDVPLHPDLYKFNNEKELIEKRYQYDVDVDYYKNILDEDVYMDIKSREENNSLKQGDLFKTKHNTYIVYIGNNHKWHHISRKLVRLFEQIKGQVVIIVGGSMEECLLDLEISAKAFGVITKRDERYIYSGTNCPIK